MNKGKSQLVNEVTKELRDALTEHPDDKELIDDCVSLFNRIKNLKKELNGDKVSPPFIEVPSSWYSMQGGCRFGIGIQGSPSSLFERASTWRVLASLFKAQAR